MTFGEYWPEYLRAKEVQLKLTSRNQYELRWESHLKDVFADICMDDVKNSLMQRYVDGRLKEKGVKAKTVMNEIIVIKNMLKLRALGTDTPVPEFSLIWPTAAKSAAARRDKFADGETAALIDSLRASDGHFCKVIALAAETGLRIGELCGLRYGDFDWQGHTLHVARTVSMTWTAARGNERYVGPPKTTASDRYVPVPAWLCAYFSRHQRTGRLPGCAYVCNDAPDAERFMTPRTVRTRFRAICASAGIRQLTFHCLRHTYASRLLMAHADVRTTAELLGHGDVGTTLNTYAHSDLRQKRSAAQKIFIRQRPNPHD